MKPLVVQSTDSDGVQHRPGCPSKRVFDVALATGCLIVALPAMLLIALSVRLTSRGPILYRGVRAGVRGAPFRILKFRSMVWNAERVGGSATAANDSRITWLGSWIRRFKVDELPQLINVIKGEMSIVGPRPEVYKYVQLYSERDQQVLSVRPGLTDWASLWDIDEGLKLQRYADPEAAYVEHILPVKLELQRYYIDNWSLLEDLKIVMYTAVKIVWPSWTPRHLKDVIYPVAEYRPTPKT